MATREQVSQQVTALHQELTRRMDDLELKLDAVLNAVGRQAEAPMARRDSQGAVHLPGTGALNKPNSDPAEDGEPLSREQMLERIRATRKRVS